MQSYFIVHSRNNITWAHWTFYKMWFVICKTEVQFHVLQSQELSPFFRSCWFEKTGLAHVLYVYAPWPRNSNYISTHNTCVWPRESDRLTCIQLVFHLYGHCQAKHENKHTVNCEVHLHQNRKCNLTQFLTVYYIYVWPLKLPMALNKVNSFM